MSREYNPRDEDFDAGADDWTCRPPNACHSESASASANPGYRLTELAKNSDCPCRDANDDRWEELLCAFVDGELAAAEAERVNQHLSGCEECLNSIASYGAIDRAVVVASLTVNDQAAASFSVEIKTSNAGSSAWILLKRLVPFAAAASIVIALGTLAFWPNSEVTADEITQPLNDVQIFQVQKQVEQDLMLDVMQYQLRALQLELDLLARETPTQQTDKASELAESVQQLLQQVQTLQDEEVVAN